MIEFNCSHFALHSASGLWILHYKVTWKCELSTSHHVQLIHFPKFPCDGKQHRSFQKLFVGHFLRHFRPNVRCKQNQNLFEHLLTLNIVEEVNCISIELFLSCLCSSGFQNPYWREASGRPSATFFGQTNNQK